jgi:hypothetical protein
MKARRMTIFGWLLVFLIGFPSVSWACSLMAVAKTEKPSLRVYFTKFLKEDTSGGKYRTCRIVKKPEEGTQTFFVTPFRQDATVVVHPSNWP